MYFDTLFWSVWNLYCRIWWICEPSGSLSAQLLSMHFFHSSKHLCTTGLSQKKLAELSILNTVVERGSLTTSAEDTKVSGEMHTWEGRANLQEDQERLEKCANNFLSFSTGKTTEVHTSLCRRNSWSLLCLVRRWRACVLLEVRCATCSQNLHPHLELQPGSRRSRQWTPLCSDISTAINISLLPFMVQARITTYSSAYFFYFTEEKRNNTLLASATQLTE